MEIKEIILPLILQRMEEQRSEKKRKTRAGEIAQAYKELMASNQAIQTGEVEGPPMSPAMAEDRKVKAFSELASLGIPASPDILKPKPQTQGFRKMFPGTDLIWDAVDTGALTFSQGLAYADDMMRQRLQSSDADLELIWNTFGKDSGFRNFDEMKAAIEFRKVFGVDALRMLPQFAAAGAGADIPDWRLKQAAIKDILEGKSYDQIDEMDRAMLDPLGISNEDLKEMYAIKDFSMSELVRVQDQVYASVTDFASPKRGSFMRWIQGIKAKSEEQRQQDRIYHKYFNKNFEKETGMPKWEYVADVAKNITAINEPLSPRLEQILNSILVKNMESQMQGENVFTARDLRRAYAQNREGWSQLLNSRELEILAAYLDLYLDAE